MLKSKVTAVIPVYNEEQFLRHCLESVVGQVDRAIIGDNASTDGTKAICREFAKKYDHVIYFCNEKNLGSAENFNLCYQRVETEFMFHVGGHDLIPPNYVDTLKKQLNRHPDAIAAYGDVHWVDVDGKGIFLEEYDNPDCSNTIGKMAAPSLVDERPLFRAAEFIFKGRPCNIIYSLFKTEGVIQYFQRFRPVYGSDIIILFNVLLHGKFVHCDETRFIRRDVHNMLTASRQVEESMKRISANTDKPDFDPMVGAIMESFRNASRDGLTEKEYEQLLDKLLKFVGWRYQYKTGIFRIDFPHSFFFTLRRIRRATKKIREPIKKIFNQHYEKKIQLKRQIKR